MTSLNCTPRCSCTALAVIGSIIVGIVTAVLVTTAIVTLTPAFLWVVLGIAVVYLPALLLFSALRRGASGCICRAVGAVLIAILGTVLFSLVLLGVAFPATGFLLPFFAGLLLFFLSLTVASTACLVRCALGCED